MRINRLSMVALLTLACASTAAFSSRTATARAAFATDCEGDACSQVTVAFDESKQQYRALNNSTDRWTRIAASNLLHVHNALGLGSIRVSGSGGGLMNFVDTAAGANQKLYQWRSEGGAFRMALLNDTEATFVKQNILVANSAGNIGIGVAAPNSLLNVGDVGDATLVMGRPNSIWTSSTGSNNAIGVIANTQAETLYKVTSGAADAKWFQVYSTGGNLGFRSLTDAYEARNETLFLSNAGSVGIGTTTPSAKLDVNGDVSVTGNVTATGNIAAKYQDVAEWAPSTQKLSAGTVVILDAERTNHVIASGSAYDTSVAGVVSDSPGVILGEGGEGKVKVATTGRVKVKVDATHAPIKIGDLLVTSSVEGVAMKSEPLIIGGRRMHAPGPILGKALEPVAGGVGEVLVLLSLQ